MDGKKDAAGVMKPYRVAWFALGKKSWRNRDRMRPWESPGRQRQEEEEGTADMWDRAAVREKGERGARACPAGPRVGPERGGRKGEGRGVRLGPISVAMAPLRELGLTGELGFRPGTGRGRVSIFFIFLLFQKPFETHLKILLNHLEF